MQVSDAELRQQILEETQVRVHHGVPKAQLLEIIQYKGDVPESPCNALRDELMEFIRTNRNRLSLPCDGDCYKHHDGVVLYCHSKLLEDNK